MTNYVWTAVDQSGNKVVREIAAATADEAKYILLAQGYTDLELKEDDVIAAANAGFAERPKMFGQEISVTAQDRIKHRDDPPATVWNVLRQGLRQSLTGCVVVTAYLGYNVVYGHYITGLLLFVGMLAWVAFRLVLGLPSVYYRKLIQALDWNRWQEVLSLVQTLKAIERINVIKVPATELLRNRAKALVGLGDLAGGLAVARQCEGRPDCPAWLYHLLLASLHVIAKQYDQAIEYNLQAIAANPTSTAYLDLANRYARYLRDPVKARAALAAAEREPIVDIARPFQIRCRGIIAYLEGDYAAARRDLEAAIQLIEQAKNRPFRDGRLSVARAYLSCVLARQGELAEAKKVFALAREYLVATGEDELLAECRDLRVE